MGKAARVPKAVLADLVQAVTPVPARAAVSQVVAVAEPVLAVPVETQLPAR
jgi:hypothetical protein